MDRNIARKASAAVLLILMASVARAQAPPAALAPLSARLQNERDNAGLQRIAPFKVFDNLYYVGVGWVASWLLTTSDGLILIDTLEPRYVDHLLDSIPGTISIEMTVSDAGTPYKAFFFGGSAPAPGVEAARQFVATVQRIEEMEQGVQVRLVNHGFSDSLFWNRVDGLARRKPGEPHPFVAPELFLPWLQPLKADAAKVIDAAGPR